MADSFKTSNQRLKILYLYKILLEHTDEEHSITMPEIIEQLALCGIQAARKALYEDIEALRSYGMDIISAKGKYSCYYVASRDFELPELKLLADAVSSSRFLTEKKSAELLKKLGTLTSKYEAKQIQRQVYVADRVKSMNERIYINIDVIHRAISEKMQIKFRYFDYDLGAKKKYREGFYTCSPYALTWNEENYYLVAYYPKYNTISNFRIDRMESIEVRTVKSRPLPDDFRLADYLNSTFSMFSGEAESVKLRFRREAGMINAVIDRFGKNISIHPDGDDHFVVRVQVKTEHPMPFFGWLFKFGTNVQILDPPELKMQYTEALRATLEEQNNV